MIKHKVQIITELNDKGFNYLRGSVDDKLDTLYRNLWSMFDLEEAKKSPESIIERLRNGNLTVDNFGWTKEVEEAFYKHPKHRHIKRTWWGQRLGFWKLNAEPSLVNKDGSLNYSG